MRKGASKTAYETGAARLPHEQLARHIVALGLADRAGYRAWCREQGFGLSLFKPWRQRNTELKRAEKLAAETRDRRELELHIQAIGIGSLAAYSDWCLAHGRTVSLHKSPAQLEAERQAIRREKAAIALSRARELRRRPEAFVRAIFDGAVPEKDLRSSGERELFALVGTLRPKDGTRAALLRLLTRFSCDIDLLTHRPAMPHLEEEWQNSLLAALFRVAGHNAQWDQEPETWRPEFGSPRRRFGSLVRHLFARYAVPTFLDAAWFEGNDPTARRHVDWFLHLGAGRNLRTADQLPIELTKRMAHYALRAPADIPIDAALRWGQVLGMGGSVRLARTVIATLLGTAQADEAFWATVVRFFVNNAMLDPAQVGPIVDYLHNQKYVARDARDEDGEWRREPPMQPDLTMKGRTPEALVRLVEAWHRELATEKRPAREWARSGIQGYEARCCTGHGDDTADTWTVQELLSSKELHQEGRYMSNCVATYAGSCANGGSSIWSMRKRTAYEAIGIRVMTIEVSNKTRQIIQARGRFNIVPGSASACAELKAAPELLRRWATQAGLTLETYAI